MTASWLNGEPAPDYERLTLTELLAVWSKNRNSIVGFMAAEEVCRRLVSRKQ